MSWADKTNLLVLTVISHRDVSNNLLENCLALDELLVLGFGILQLFAEFLRKNDEVKNMKAQLMS